MSRYAKRTLFEKQVGQWTSKSSLRTLSYTNPRMSAGYTGVVLTSGSTVHTYGAWTEIIASAPADTSALFIETFANGFSGFNTASVISIGVGAAGSEVELFYFACAGASRSITGYPTGLYFQIPVQINSGTRISARLQQIFSAGTASILIQTFDSYAPDFIYQPKTFDSLGVNLSTSEGTSIAATNTYSEVVASTARPYRGLVLIPSLATTAASTVAPRVTVAVGAAGAEVEVGSVTCATTTSELIYSLLQYFIGTPIPAGSRLSVKQDTAATTLDATIIGVI